MDPDISMPGALSTVQYIAYGGGGENQGKYPRDGQIRHLIQQWRSNQGVERLWMQAWVVMIMFVYRISIGS